ncbi:MAG: FG-GAP repeat protein [Phycisphaerales bacterium]|nr:FG-GAP repeat protein [Phycisphaerales bacterium]
MSMRCIFGIVSVAGLACGAAGQSGEYVLDGTVGGSVGESAGTTVPSDRVEKAFYYDVLMGGAPRLGSENSDPVVMIHTDGDEVGSSVAMGDFDGDGHQDLVIAAKGAHPVKDTNGIVEELGVSGGQIFIIYGGHPGLAPLDPLLKRYGVASDHSEFDRHLPDGFFYDAAPVGDESNAGEFPNYWDSPPWYNLFDVDGYRRFSGDNSPESLNGGADRGPALDEYIRGAVLYAEHGTRVIDDLDQNGDVIEHLVDLANSRFSGTHPSFPNQNGLYATSTQPMLSTNGDVVKPATKMPGDLAGFAVSNAGDVNGDGIDDLLIGAPLYSHKDFIPDPVAYGFPPGTVVGTPNNQPGCVYLIFGNSGGLSGAFGLDQVGNDPDGPGPKVEIEGVKFVGSEIHVKMGQDVRNASSLMKSNPAGDSRDGWSDLDFNGDGLADIVLGAQSADGGSVLQHLGPSFTVNDTDGDGNPGPSIGHDNTGVDPEGLDAGNGACVIIYGEKANGVGKNPWAESRYELPKDLGINSGVGIDYETDQYSNSGVNPTNNGVLDAAFLLGDQQYGYLGYAGFAGDFDGAEDDTFTVNEPGKKYADIVISAPHHIGDDFTGVNADYQDQSGEAYIVFGSSVPLRGVYLIRDLVGVTRDANQSVQRTRAIRIQGEHNTLGELGSNGDPIRFSDFKDPIPNDPDPMNPTSLELTSGSDMGWSVMAAGDVDKDGKAEVLIGAPDLRVKEISAFEDAAPRRATGKAYLLYGFEPEHITASSGPSDYVYSLDDFRTDGSMVGGLATFYGESNGSLTGRQVFCAGDINGDEYADFVIGAPLADHYYDPNDSSVFHDNVGAVYLVYGKPRTASNPLVGPLELHQVGDDDGIADGYEDIYGAVFYGDHHQQVNGTAVLPGHLRAGTWVVGGHDLDGDNVVDLLIGDPKATRVLEDRFEDPRDFVRFSPQGAAYIVYGVHEVEDAASGELYDRNMDVDQDLGLDCTDLFQYRAFLDHGIMDIGSAYHDINHDGVRDELDYQLMVDTFNRLNISCP